MNRILDILTGILWITSLSRAAPGGARQARFRSMSNRPQMPYDLKGRCGNTGVKAYHKPMFKILNGTCAPYGSHPWIAQIQVNADGNNFEHHCGGTILTEDVILTAAHCFQTVRHNYMRVVVGQGSLSEFDEDEMTFDIEDAIIHPNWDSPMDGRHSNDVALIKIRRKGDGSGIVFSDRVAPACLPMHDTPQKPGTECVISGWGKTDPNNHSAKTDCLRTANVPIIDHGECKEMYSQSNRDVVKGMMCAGFKEGGIDTCSGDSGGPLTCKIDGKFHITGIVSWGVGCGEPNKPGVYSNVKHYLNWINQSIAEM